MDKERWQILEQLFTRAVEVPARERSAWLKEHCEDPQIRQELEALLSSDGSNADPTRIIRQSVAELPGSEHEAEVSDLSGQEIGAWRLLEQVGAGGMGTVYLAERCDGLFEQKGAVKLLNPAVFSEQTRVRFLNERQILADLEHPNIARLLDGGTTPEGLPFLVLEYVEGERIDEYCSRANLSVEARCRLFIAVCEAVQFAHGHLVVHRDLKPSNIMVTADGVPKLLDFGIAKLLEPDDNFLLTMTMHGRPMTPQYASPEQRLGLPVTTSSDVYALGLLLYRLLAGVLPARLREGDSLTGDDTGTELPSAASHADGDPALEVRRSSRRRELKGDLDNIVMMAIREDPSRRYASVDSLAKDVSRYLRHEPVTARADSWTYRSAKFLRRHRQGVGFALALFVSVIALTVFYTGRLAKERDLAALEATKANRIASFLVDIFEQADPVNASMEELSAIDLLDQAVESIDNELADEPAARGYLLTVMSHSYRELGRFESSLETSNAGVAALREAGPEAEAELISALIGTGVILRVQGNYQAALGPLEEALVLVRKPGNWTAAYESRVMNNIGLLYKEMGDYKRAEEFLEASVAISIKSNGEMHPNSADAMNNFAITIQNMGAYEKGAEYACRAAEIGKETLPRVHSNLATYINNCGLALRKLGRWDEALIQYKDSLSRREELAGKNSYETIFSSLALSNLYREMQDYELAEFHLEQALIPVKKYFPEASPDRGRYLRSLGNLQFEKGEYSNALETFETTLDLYRGTLGEEHLSTALVAVKVARCLTRLNRPEEAGVLLDEYGDRVDEQFQADNMVRYPVQITRAEWSEALNQPAESRFWYKAALDNCEANVGANSYCTLKPQAALNGLSP